MGKTRTIELPSDSHFAVALKSQQQAEREEQQRIKNLVLNYDLRDQDTNDGEAESLLHSISPNPNTKGIKGFERQSHTRQDRSGQNRGSQRARKLQLSDVEWYTSRSKPKTKHGTKD